jgi:predicted transcriptional regulator
MGQEEILRLLETSKAPLSVSEIANKLDNRVSTVFRACTIMLEYGEVYSKVVKRNCNNHIKSVRLYYLKRGKRK